MKITRLIVPAALAATAVLSAGCTITSTTSVNGVECVSSGSVSDSIKVSGSLTSSPKLKTDTPIKSSKLERTVLNTDDKGEAVSEGAGLITATAFFNGSTGALLTAAQPIGTVYQKNQMENAFPWEKAVFTCAIQGERVAVTGTVKQMFNSSASELGLNNLKDSDTVVAVSDVLKVADLANPKGSMKQLGKGLPEVKNGKKNAGPEITIPEGAAAPAELKVGTLINGKGAKVKDGDIVFVNYRGVIWASGKEFDSSYGKAPVAFSTQGVIPGFSKALVGQKVGSRVISIVPPAEGYGEQLTQMGLNADDVMVFVLDILSAYTPDEQ